MGVAGCYLIYKIFAIWDGGQTESGYKLRYRGEEPRLTLEAFAELRRLMAGEFKQEIFDPIEDWRKPVPLKAPSISLSWKDQARELVSLKWRSYRFSDAPEAWHDLESCWIGENDRSGTNCLLFCPREEPSVDGLERAINYLMKLTGAPAGECEAIVVHTGHGRRDPFHHNGVIVRWESEESLLDDLVDFTDYFRDLVRRVEVNSLPDSDELTLPDIFVPLKISDSSGNEVPNDLGGLLNAWSQEKSQRHLAILGQYGQGKSTGMLMYSYRIAKAALEAKQLPVRVPILIILRGHSPSRLDALEHLGAWAGKYDLSPQALWKLHTAGRLTIIFEGFDEMAEVATEEARLQHFAAMWRFAHPKGKLIFTGRPHFFFEERELMSALGIGPENQEGPHCEAFRLRFFDIEEIEAGLRNAPKVTRQEIVDIADTNESFRDIAGRPSLLYNISQIWEDLGAEDRREKITSALVVGRFLESSYRRQTLKASKYQEQASIQTDQLKAEFMALSEAERAYFMEGIAVHMAARNYPNQISGRELNNTIEQLLETIPEGVPAKDTIIQMGNRAPLRMRIQANPDGPNLLKLNIRTYGVLVDDPSRHGAFQFAHKSFFEYLVGAYYASKLGVTDPAAVIAKNYRSAPCFDTILENREIFWMTADILFGSFAVKHSTITDELIFRQLGISGTYGILSKLSRLPIYGVLINFFLSALVEVRKHSPDPVIRYMPILVATVTALLFITWGIEIRSSKFSFPMELNTAFVIAVVGWIIVTFPLLFLGLAVRTPLVKMLLGRYLVLKYLSSDQRSSFRHAAVVGLKTQASRILFLLGGRSLDNVLDQYINRIHLQTPDGDLAK